MEAKAGRKPAAGSTLRPSFGFTRSWGTFDNNPHLFRERIATYRAETPPCLILSFAQAAILPDATQPKPLPARSSHAQAAILPDATEPKPLPCLRIPSLLDTTEDEEFPISFDEDEECPNFVLTEHFLNRNGGEIGFLIPTNGDKVRGYTQLKLKMGHAIWVPGLRD